MFQLSEYCAFHRLYNMLSPARVCSTIIPMERLFCHIDDRFCIRGRSYGQGTESRGSAAAYAADACDWDGPGDHHGGPGAGGYDCEAYG